MYVVHMPVVMAFQIALAGVPIPTEAKVLLVAAGSAFTLVASYDLVARPTWISVLLNGRRYPRRYFVRRTPALDAPGAAKLRPQAPEPIAPRPQDRLGRQTTPLCGGRSTARSRVPGVARDGCWRSASPGDLVALVVHGDAGQTRRSSSTRWLTRRKSGDSLGLLGR
jgi:hypothetical protein